MTDTELGQTGCEEREMFGRRGRRSAGAIAGSITIIAIALSAPIRAETPGAAVVARKAHDAQGAAPPSANDRMLKPGAEDQQLARRVGAWDVVMTVRPTADATPIVVKGMIADRFMVGLYLQETMRPAPGSNLPNFRRLAYLTYNHVEARWQYTSMDTRAPIGIMSAKSYGNEQGADITVYFEGFALPGFGPEVEGRFVRARHVIKRESDDHDFAQQYWTAVGGREWLTVQYEFTRRR